MRQRGRLERKKSSAALAAYGHRDHSLYMSNIMSGPRLINEFNPFAVHESYFHEVMKFSELRDDPEQLYFSQEHMASG